MPAVSEKQKRFFGLLEGIKHGTVKNASASAKKAASSMSKSQIDDFVKGPVKKHKNALRKFM